MKSKFFVLFLFPILLSSCGAPKSETEKRIDEILSQMTLEEKIGQMSQLSYDVSGDVGGAIAEGRVGSLLNVVDPVKVNELQKIAVEQSRLGIPLVIGRDVIHGLKTIFPIPIGQAATFNPEIVEQGAAVAARESRSVGIHWTFAPMLDISRDQRWGRLAEGMGEDPYLGGVMGAAMVRGFQGNDLASANSIAACVKHFVAYGAAEGGRDYGSTSVPPHLMRNVYLVPFKAAIDAGAATLMTSFNDNDGIPGTGNKALVRDMLRDEWGWDGMVVSDWASVTEMVVHGFAADDKEAAARAVNAGVDMEMVSTSYVGYLAELIKEGKVSQEYVDESVRNVLRLKFRLGLFDSPYVDLSVPSPLYAPEHLAAAQTAAEQSAVLLKNDGVLPLEGVRTVALVGPMSDAPHDQLGTWIFDGEKSHTVTVAAAMREMLGEDITVIHENGVEYSRDRSVANIPRAVAAARRADVVVAVVGEEAILSGEAHSLADPSLKGAQEELIRELSKTGKPLVLVVMAGRPLLIGDEVEMANAVLYSFHPGTMGGPAIVRLLTGEVSPSGRLPMSFAREVGQIPVYYNHNRTGRPFRGGEVLIDDIPLEAGQSSLGNTSYYLDAGSAAPLFPFGYGLTYTTFEYSGVGVSAEVMEMDGGVEVSATIKNTGSREGTEVVQLYVNDVAGSIARPVKELKGFQRVTLGAGESRRVSFTLTADDLAFWGIDMEYKAEPGDFRVWIGPDSSEGLESRFTLR